jgi:hypothetical protein
MASSDIWFYAFWIMYFLFLATVYYGFARKVITRIMNRTMFLHYHFLDTGDNGDMVFTEGVNIINGMPHTYRGDMVQGNVIYFNSNEVEPVKVEKDITRYTYFCFTNEFDIVKKQDVLDTLLIFGSKREIIGAIILMGFIILIGLVAIFYFNSTWHDDLSTSLSHIQTAINQSSAQDITKIKGKP